MKDEHTSAAALNEHPARVPEEDRSDGLSDGHQTTWSDIWIDGRRFLGLASDQVPVFPHSGGDCRVTDRELTIPVRIELEAEHLAAVERLATLLEERRAEDARAVRRAWWIAGLAVLNAILSLVVLALLAMGRWT